MKPKKIIALNNTNDIVYWVMKGIEFGYPACCIGEFIITIVKRTYSKRDKRKFNGTGFVPCIKCEHKKTKKQILAFIKENRSTELPPFPLDSPD